MLYMRATLADSQSRNIEKIALMEDAVCLVFRKLDT